MSNIVGFHDKVYNYLKNNPVYPLRETPLWFPQPGTHDPDLEEYLYQVAGSFSALNSINDGSLLLYGSLESKEPKINLVNKELGKVESFSLVNTAYEYYFTDLVFIQNKYEEAILDLYLYRAEQPFKSGNINENLETIDFMIKATYMIAEKCGFKLEEKKVFDQFINQIDIATTILQENLHNKIGKYLKNATLHEKMIASLVKEYYLNPTEKNYKNFCKYFSTIQEELNNLPEILVNDVDIKPYLIGSISYIDSNTGLTLPSFE